MNLGVSTPLQNAVLAALPADEFERLSPDLERLSMPAGEVIHEAGVEQAYVWFPASCVVCLQHATKAGALAGIAVTGNEGIVGVQLVMGSPSSTTRAVVLSEGEAYRLRADVLHRELALGGKLQAFALRAIQALITQMAQTAVCNRHHQIDQQLCRWLLLNLDRHSTQKLNMTQELIANMLGVRREGVTEAASKLQSRGVIHYSRGHLTVLDRQALESSACECYAVVKNEYNRLMPSNPTELLHATKST